MIPTLLHLRRALPFTHVPEVFHYGHLDSPPSCHGPSHEGCLLSCAHDREVADAWCSIARLGGLPLWALTKPGGFTLLDFLALTSSQKQQLLATAVAQGLLQVGHAFKGSYYDDEADSRVFSLYDTLQDARRETDGQPARRIHRLRVHRATPALTAYWQSRHGGRGISLSFVTDAAIAYLVDHFHPEADGIFWDEELDPARLSAPRIGLFQRTLARSARAVT